ncbi:MAG: hypothetical protein M1819_007052 [Sarea resinae]|nr:MAG: hypothetical protein M1819_007052 [Sarea resinae]
MSSKEFARSAQSAARAISITKKYTVPSTGIWERIRKTLSLDPNRSTGVPINAHFRNPSPGALPPQSYDDPVTIPAGDIADNPYWKRDQRRSYPRLSVVKPADVVGLLSVGSKAAPKDDVLQIGEAGSKQLVEVQQEGEKGLATLFEKDKKTIAGVLGKNGLPPLPANLARNPRDRNYVLDHESGFPEQYAHPDTFI